MKVGYVQLNPIFGEKEKNFEQVELLLSNVKADLLVLPELFASGYNFKSKNEVFGSAEEENGETTKFLQEMGKKTGAIMIGGFVEKDGDSIYNSAMMVSEKGLIDVYRKIHLFYKEKKWFLPGNRKLKINNINGVKIGMMICFDWLFPEVIRTLSLGGAEIIAHPANLVMPYCQNAMKTRCFCNKIFAITSNRFGTEERGKGKDKDKFVFSGSSQITSCDGSILSSAPHDKDYVGIVEINPKDAQNKNINDFNNVHSDRREKFYWYNLKT